MKTKNYLFAMLAALMLSACNNTDGIIPPLDEQSITVNAYNKLPIDLTVTSQTPNYYTMIA